MTTATPTANDVPLSEALSLNDLAAKSTSPFDLIPHLERGQHRRGDAAWLEARLADPATEFIPVWQLQNLVTGDPPRVARLHVADMAEWLPRAESISLLGLRVEAGEEQAVFAVGLHQHDSRAPTSSEDAESPLPGAGQWVNPRAVADLLNAADWALLMHARAMAYWHHRCRYCSDCGSPTASAQAGTVRRCGNPACGQEHYPRTDPAIIVLVYSGERCLLGHQASWTPGRFSTLAGFVEPGESVEQAVAREVLEESGIRLREVRYFGSQSFPFPASLMLGFHAEAASEEIQLNDGELGEARWFTRRELRAALDAGTVSLPPSYAISHRLITAWFNS